MIIGAELVLFLFLYISLSFRKKHRGKCIFFSMASLTFAVQINFNWNWIQSIQKGLWGTMTWIPSSAPVIYMHGHIFFCFPLKFLLITWTLFVFVYKGCSFHICLSSTDRRLGSHLVRPYLQQVLAQATLDCYVSSFFFLVRLLKLIMCIYNHLHITLSLHIAELNWTYSSPKAWL